MPALGDPALADAVQSGRVLRFQHGLGEDPRLDPDVVPALIPQVPARQIVQHLGDLPLLLPRGDAPSLDLPADQIAREIRHNGCWVRVGEIDRLPEWSDLLAECLTGIGPTSDRHAQLFLASAGAVTPAHFDTYHNLLFQTRGTKELSIGTFVDPDTTRREVARHFGPDPENLRELPTRVSVFHLEPGDGLYLPPGTFHWARCGPSVSLALSCTFSNTASRRTAQIHIFNAHLRRLGLEPALPGSSPLRDGAKYWLGRTWRATRRLRHARIFRKGPASSP